MRSQFRITLKLKSTKADFDKAVSSSRSMSDKAKELKKSLADYVAKAEGILDNKKDSAGRNCYRYLRRSN